MARVQEPPPNVPIVTEPADQRFVYNGETITPGIDPAIRNNRPARRKQRSPFKSMFILLGISLTIVFYIWNKLAVNKLAKEVDDLQSQYQKMVSVNELLKAEVTKKSQLERIEKLAVENLKMTYPKEQPVWFDVDPDKLKSVQ